MRGRDAEGFTLPELLVAITILGIIMVAIGAMITTAFRTSTIVGAELQGSRAPKTVSRYWVPDVEQAAAVTERDSLGCGSGDRAVVALTSTVFPSAFDHTDQGDDVGRSRVVAYWDTMNGRREQLVRWVCEAGVAPTSLVVVSDLQNVPTVATVATNGLRATLTVIVPDRSRPDDVYTFDVTATSQLTTTSSPT